MLGILHIYQVVLPKPTVTGHVLDAWIWFWIRCWDSPQIHAYLDYDINYEHEYVWTTLTTNFKPWIIINVQHNVTIIIIKNVPDSLP